MSLQNLLEKNNQELFCKKITVDEYEIDSLVVDSIVVENATVLTQVTTPHINSGTSVFNTVGTVNLDADNGTIENLTVVNNLSVGNTATINTLNVNTTVTAPNVNTNNITSPSGNISNLNSSTITASNANLDSISGSNLSYGVGNIGEISGSILNYDTGYIDSSSTKRLEIFTELVACPTATIDNLTINSSFSAPLFEAPDMHVDFVRSYSAGKTTFQENVIVDTEINCPLIGANTIHGNGSSTINVINDVAAPNINLSGTITAANSRTNTINTVSGTGFINCIRPLSLPNILSSQGLAYYSYNAGTLNVTGCITTTINYYAVRVGNMITVHLQCFVASTNAVSTNIMILNGFQSQYFPALGTANGICLVNSAAGPVAGSYKFLTSGTLNIYGTTGFGNFTTGQPCGLAGSLTEYASFNFITNN